MAESPIKPQTIEQQRAAFAMGWVTQDCDGTVGKELKSAAENFPILILTSGLGQAAAFYKSKSQEHRALYALLSQWLGPAHQACYTDTDLLAGITQGDQASYRTAQVEALALLAWVKKFAKAYGKED